MGGAAGGACVRGRSAACAAACGARLASMAVFFLCGETNAILRRVSCRAARSGASMRRRVAYANNMLLTG